MPMRISILRVVWFNFYCGAFVRHCGSRTAGEAKFAILGEFALPTAENSASEKGE